MTSTETARATWKYRQPGHRDQGLQRTARAVASVPLLVATVRSSSGLSRTRLLQPPLQVVANAQGVSHNGQGRIHGATGREEAGVDDVEVVDIMRFAVHIERRRLWIMGKSDGAVLVRHASQGDALANEQAAGQQAFVAGVPMHGAPGLLHQMLASGDEALVTLCIVRRVGEHDAALPVKADAILRRRQILRSEPEVERVPGHQVERPPRRQGWRTSLQLFRIELANEGNMTHRVVPVFVAEIKIVHRQGLLKYRRIGTFREGHEHRVDVSHIMPSDRARTVGQAVGVPVVGRP